MNKSNVCRSSEFHMDIGDVLHYILIVDSGATPTIDLVSVGTIDNSNDVPDAVVALDASDITSSSFTANWNFIENSSGYYLDVATDSAFTAFVAGYNNLSVGYVNERAVVGLDDAITYYYRVRAVNDNGTGDSSNTITTTTDMELVVDADGNVYTYVIIGTQQWMVENFRSTKYVDGTAIPNLTLNADWIAEDGTPGHDGAYCYYNNDVAYNTDYGKLYNWYAVDNAHGLAPTGWRVPSDADWITLRTFLGGDDVAGGKLKEIGLAHWNAPNVGATDDYGYRGVGAGIRSSSGNFSYVNIENDIWSSSSPSFRRLLNEAIYFYQYGPGPFRNGMTVRMMRDV